MKIKYFDKTQALIVFYVAQQAIDAGAKYIYITDEAQILAYKEPMLPSDMELSKSELVLTLQNQKETTPEDSSPCPSSDWFKRYMLHYVKNASTVDLFEKMGNVTKEEYLPLVDEILKRYNERKPNTK